MHFSVWTFHLSSLYLSTHCKRWVTSPPSSPLQLDHNLTRNSVLKPSKSIALVIFAIDGIVEGNSLIAAFHLSAASLVNTNSKISSSFKASRSFDYVDKKLELTDYNYTYSALSNQTLINNVNNQSYLLAAGSKQTVDMRKLMLHFYCSSCTNACLDAIISSII